MRSSSIYKENSFFENRINILEEIFKLSISQSGETIFSSHSFERMVFARDCTSGRLKIIRDFFPQKKSYLYHISFSAYITTHIQFSMEADCISHKGISGRVGTFIQKQEQSFVTPNLPTIRCWNKKRHIVYERFDYYTEYKNQGIVFEVDFLENESFDLIVLNIPNDEVTIISDIYRKPEKEYTLTGPWIAVSPLLDCWKFMIDGNIYEYRKGTSREASARFGSQQAALFLYKLVSIQEEYAKELAKLIKDEIAYSVLLNLEYDGRWVHGCWTDEMETHTRFQVDGIHLLLDYFEETKDPIFLEKAVLAVNYLLSLTDTLEGGTLWLLHDTLELGKNYIYPVIKSKAFKKSETNILCLNTHLSALCVLLRLYEYTRNEELKEAIDRGLKATEMVLMAEPATGLYKLLYYFVDVSFDRTYGGVSKKFKSLKEAFKILLGLGADRLIPYVKKAFPRFIMPNGFTTRHLSLRDDSYHYHIINLYDMLVLYQLLVLNKYNGLEWLWNSIDRAIDYCFKGCLIRSLIRNGDKFVPQLIEIFIMYGAFNNVFDKKKLVDITLSLKDKGYKFTSGSYGFDNLVTPKQYQVSGVVLGTDSPHIESFSTSPRDGRWKELLIINTGIKKEEVSIALEDSSKRLEVVLPNGEKIEPSRFIIDFGDYFLVRLYDI